MPEEPPAPSPLPDSEPASQAGPADRGRPVCSSADEDKVICERCNKAEMYRMHAVWRCPECGYKTDCCGW